MLKGKIAWVYRGELERIAPDLGVELTDVEPWYDVLEEHFSEQHFALPDDDLEFRRIYSKGQFTVIEYNCIVFYVVQREEKKVIHKIGFVYMGINNPRMDDLSKLSYALNHLRIPSVNGVPEPDGQRAYKYLQDYIEKMKELGVSNIKELLNERADNK